jgi:hypothetical protein
LEQAMTEKKTTFPQTPTTATATVVSVPWDPQILKGRECSNCACYFEQANPDNPQQVQGFCRRLPADMAEIRVQEVRRDLNGNVVMKNGAPVIQPNKVIGYLFKATKREGICFDGWRAAGTLPGERAIDASIRQLRDRIEPVLADIPQPYRPFFAALFGLDTLETKN